MKDLKIGQLNLSGKKLLIEGIMTLLVGLLLLQFRETVPTLVIKLGLVWILLGALLNLLFGWLRKKDQVTESWLHSLIKVLVAGSLLTSSLAVNLPIYLMALIFALYEIFLAFINGVTYWLYRQNKIKPRWRYLVDALLWGNLGIVSLLSQDGKASRQLFWFGLYLVFLGLTNIRDGLFFNKDLTHSQLKRRVRVSLPIVLSALIPAATLSKLNAYLAEEDGVSAAAIYNDKKIDEPTDLEVLVHTSDSDLFGAIGHVDLCYKGRVISYGSYDVFSEKLFGMIGDGVLFNAEKEAYIDLCKRESQKTLFAYGIKLTDEQRQAVEKRLAELESLTVPFEPRTEKLEKTGDYTYPYKLAHEADGRIYKFKSSKFKTYFVLSTNCVLLADSIVGQAGTDILSSKGFITPGTYKDYMEREYARPHSLVVNRSVY